MTIDQCCGSVTFWCGSGSGSEDPYLLLMDPDQNSDADPDMVADPDPPIFVIDLQEANKLRLLIRDPNQKKLFDLTKQSC